MPRDRRHAPGAPGPEWAVFRALQFAWFTTPLAARRADDDILRAIAGVAGIDAAAVVAAIDTPAVREAYERDRADARTAAGAPTEFQGKAANTDGTVRYTAPSLVFETEDGRSLEAGGWQPIEAYDVLIANLDPALERRDAARGPALDCSPSSRTGSRPRRSPR